jgi:hypothetical protein
LPSPQFPPIWLAAAIASLSLLLTGCSDSARKPVYPVRGEVFVQNQPAAGAMVILHPVADANPDDWPDGYPRGVVKVDGSFQIGTYGDQDGAPAGEYIVLVRWPQVQPGTSPDNTEAPTVDRLAGRYVDPAQSKLRAKVEEKPTELSRFELK